MDIITSDSRRSLEATHTTSQTRPTASDGAQSRQSVRLPDKPLVTIEPGKGWARLALGDMWPYRELLYFLIWRDVKVRYKQTVLGVAWAIIQPLFTMMIFTLF